MENYLYVPFKGSWKEFKRWLDTADIHELAMEYVIENDGDPDLQYSRNGRAWEIANQMIARTGYDLAKEHIVKAKQTYSLIVPVKKKDI